MILAMSNHLCNGGRVGASCEEAMFPSPSHMLWSKQGPPRGLAAGVPRHIIIIDRS
jgi:hypothetical protein